MSKVCEELSNEEWATITTNSWWWWIMCNWYEITGETFMRRKNNVLFPPLQFQHNSTVISNLWYEISMALHLLLSFYWLQFFETQGDKNVILSTSRALQIMWCQKSVVLFEPYRNITVIIIEVGVVVPVKYRFELYHQFASNWVKLEWTEWVWAVIFDHSYQMHSPVSHVC